MSKAGRQALRISITDGRGRPIRMPALARWLARVAPARARGEVGIALVGDVRMRRLNRTYRRHDYATDVLSFAEPPPPKFNPDKYLGDIVIARRVALRQARASGHALEAELRILALHGLLHLLGYDHEQDQGQMERLEARLRKKGGL